MRRRALFIGLAALAGLALLWQRGDGARGPRASGAALYDRYCLACHGAEGDGRGPGAPYLWPRPRDFGRGSYKWRSTPSGQPPTDADLAAAIRHGVPGTSMHAFGAYLGDPEVEALVEVVKSFAPDEFERPAEPVEIGAPPAPAETLAARGEALYQSLGCAQCHGTGGAGDGPSAAALTDADGNPAAPYDLTREPPRRPRAPGSSTVAAIYESLVTGLDGTPMPSYQGAAPAADLWAVAAYVDSLRSKAGAAAGDPTVLHPIARRLDRKQRLTRIGYHPGGDPAAAPIFGQGIPPQGEPPASLAPAQASLDARQCARCHAAQYRQWRGSVHAAASSPGLLAQLLPMEAHGKAQSLLSCQRCHAPLAEQSPLSPRGTGHAAYDPELRDQGISCAGCHVRGWHRYGPPGVDGALLDLPSYPLTTLAVYERSDFCLPCHQLTPRSALEGKPLLNTYKEWLEGPYMRRGVQCQHCHMPNREHSWKGVHDPETFRQGIDLSARALRAPAGSVTVRAKVTNVGAGHYLPTTPTPAAFVTVELIDARGRAIEGARAERRIGRHLVFQGGRFQELEDTRIPPGESFDVAVAWEGGRVADATRAVVTVRVEPDEYYERLYRRRLAGRLSADERRLFQDALERAEGSHFVAERRVLDIAPIGRSPASP